MACDCGSGQYFAFLIRSCLVLNIFPFPVTKAKLIPVGEISKNRKRGLDISVIRLSFRVPYAAPILFGAAIYMPLIREVQRARPIVTISPGETQH